MKINILNLVFNAKCIKIKFKQISKEKKESDWQIRHWFVCAGKIHRLMIQINQVNCIHQCMHTQSCTNRRWRLIFNHYDYRPEINSFYKSTSNGDATRIIVRRTYIISDKMKSNKTKLKPVRRFHMAINITMPPVQRNSSCINHKWL